MLEGGEATNCGKLLMLGGAELRRGLEKAVLSEAWLIPGTRGGLCGLQPGIGLASNALGETRGVEPRAPCIGTLIGVNIRFP